MLEVIKTRRSTRKFKKDAVPAEMLETVVEAGRLAPTGMNEQATHFIAITNPEVLKNLKNLVMQEFAKMAGHEDLDKSAKNSVDQSVNGTYAFFYDAPALILTANRTDNSNGLPDCSCAMENMMLMANALDLGSCWINQLRKLNDNEVITEYLRTLGLEENEKVYASLALGFADTEDGLPNREEYVRKGNPVTFVK